VFDSEPVGPARVGVESSQYSNSICNIWTSSGSKVQQSTNSREIRSLTHGFSFLCILRALSVREAKARFHGSGVFKPKLAESAQSTAELLK